MAGKPGGSAGQHPSPRHAAHTERARLVDEELPRLAKGIERLTKRLAAVNDDGVAAAIQGELKAMVTDRKAVEARLLVLEADSRALADQAAEVERLREAWQGWAGALEDGVRGEALQVRARALIKKALVTPLYLRRDEAGGWLFAGLSTYDRVLSGGLGADGFTIREYPEAADRDRLFLQMVNALGLDDTATPRRHRVVTFEAPRPIAGSSDAPVQDGQSTDTAPHTPHRSSRPGEAGALLVIPTRSRLAKNLLQALHALGDGALGGPKGRGRRGRRAGGETDVDLGGLAGHHLDLAHLRGVTRVRHEQAIGAFLHRAARLAARRRQRRDQRILGCQQLEHGIDHRLA
ncbi:MAG TPA: hypothetical protein VGD07_21020 [Methylomirabilota bacterium]